MRSVRSSLPPTGSPSRSERVRLPIASTPWLAGPESTCARQPASLRLGRDRDARRAGRDSSGHAALRSRGLSDREIEVLALVAAGLSNQQIGDRLFISRKTASVHVSHILDKLAVSTRTEAATIGVRLGLPEVALDDR